MGLNNGNDKDNSYIPAFLAKVAEQTAENQAFIWIRDIRPGLLEYVAPRLTDWARDANVADIRICVASNGGDLDEALAIYSLIRSIQKPTLAHVWWAYSGGVLVALACDRRVGFEATTVLIHDPWMAVEGRSDYIQDHVQGVELKRKLVNKIFLERTKLTKRKLQAMQRKEWWMDSRDALRYGIITETVADETLLPTPADNEDVN